MFAKVLLLLIGLVAFGKAQQYPTFPDNIIAFPNTDTIQVFGYNGGNPLTKYTGRKMQVQVYRSINFVNTLIGEAYPTVSGKTIAFDINHPFGVCWGYGSNYQVTPELQANDEIFLKVDGVQVGYSKILPVAITSKTISNNVITVTGNGVPAFFNNLECRIINPALVNTLVGRRDVRALPSVPFGNAVGYTATLTTYFDTFTCTYNFFDAANAPNPLLAELAFGGQMQVISWQNTDTAGNAQAVTISDFGLSGGPMDNTCPPVASAVVPSAPDAIGYANSKIYWNPATNILGATNKFNYYQVESTRVNANGATVAINGMRLNSDARSMSTSNSIIAGDTIAVRAWANPSNNVDQLSLTKKLTVSGVNSPTPPTPSISDVSATGFVTITCPLPGFQIAYSISPATGAFVFPTLGNADTFIYSKPFQISGYQTVTAFCFDIYGHEGNIYAYGGLKYYNPIKKVEAVTAVTNGLSGITVAWAPYTASTFTGYEIYILKGTTKTLVKTVASTSASWADISDGLVGGTSYSFVVTPINVVAGITYRGPDSTASTPAVFMRGKTDTLTNVIAKYNGNVLTVSGAGSMDGARITVIDPQTNKVLNGLTLNYVSGGVFSVSITLTTANVFAVHVLSSNGFNDLNVMVA